VVLPRLRLQRHPAALAVPVRGQPGSTPAAKPCSASSTTTPPTSPGTSAGTPRSPGPSPADPPPRGLPDPAGGIHRQKKPAGPAPRTAQARPRPGGLEAVSSPPEQDKESPYACTGWRAQHAIGARFGEAFIPNPVGTRFQP